MQPWFALIVSCCALVGNADSARAATADITVQDAQQPLAGLKVELRSDRHFMKHVLQSVPLDKDGHAHFENVPANESINFCIAADGYVHAVRSAYLDANESLHESITLYRPVQSGITCKAPDGSPLAGVRIGRLVYSSPDGTGVVLTEAEATHLGIPCNESDKDGRLAMPPLPEGGKIVRLDLWHPKYWFDQLKTLDIQNAEVASIVGITGCQLTFDIFDSSDKPLVADRSFVELTIDASAVDDQSSYFRSIKTPIDASKITIGVPTRVYDMLLLRNPNYVLGPPLLNSSDNPSTLMDLRDKAEQRIRINAQQIVKATGRVVDNDGNPLPNVSVGASRRTRNTDQFDSSTPEKPTGRFKFNRENDRTGTVTDSNGNFEIDAVVGDTNVIAVSGTHLMTDDTLVLHVESATAPISPLRIEMQPMPKLRGQIIDVQGKPIAGGVAIMRTAGDYDRSCFAIADQDGNFEITLDRAPVDDEGNVLRQVAIAALDPNSSTAGLSYVNIADPSQTHSINVTLAPRDSNWIFDSVPHLTTNIHFTPQEHAKILDKMKQAGPDGHPGMVAPEITGTWFNTENTKLFDFRGKFVFLDFWFIGCGPCEYDLPSIKAAAQLFRGDDFEIVAVHVTHNEPAEVQKYLKEKGIDYPVVMLEKDSPVNAALARCGIDMYPQYAIIDPQGKFVINDPVSMGPHLRTYKLEQIHRILQESRSKSH